MTIKEKELFTEEDKDLMYLSMIKAKGDWKSHEEYVRTQTLQEVKKEIGKFEKEWKNDLIVKYIDNSFEGEFTRDWNKLKQNLGIE